MPTYEYHCTKCQHEFEQFQSMRDETLKVCPKCRKSALKRRVGGGAGLIFKGTGFYITDYKNKGGSGKEGGGESKGSESKSGGETKTTSPAATGGGKPAAAPKP